MTGASPLTYTTTMVCEDYPCCGHGPPPMGDGGGCPDSEGRFDCVTCGRKLPKSASSSICGRCRGEMARRDPDEQDYLDQMEENQRYRDGGW